MLSGSYSIESLGTFGGTWADSMMGRVGGLTLCDYGAHIRMHSASVDHLENLGVPLKVAECSDRPIDG